MLELPARGPDGFNRGRVHRVVLDLAPAGVLHGLADVPGLLGPVRAELVGGVLHIRCHAVGQQPWPRSRGPTRPLVGEARSVQCGLLRPGVE
eukprot:8776458-Pyramimonas_sp.AAC.1